MNDLDEMKLARVIDACDWIDGRVKMQKIVYLLTTMGYDLPFDDFRIRQHGPYSRAVACATDTLKETGFLQEQATPLPFTNEFGQQAQQYSYQVRETARPLFRKHFDIAPPPGKPAIEIVAASLRQYDRAVLEVAATKIFLQREGKAGEELDTELHRLKGHLVEHFEEANALAKTWGQQGWL